MTKLDSYQLLNLYTIISKMQALAIYLSSSILNTTLISHSKKHLTLVPGLNQLKIGR